MTHGPDFKVEKIPTIHYLFWDTQLRLWGVIGSAGKKPLSLRGQCRQTARSVFHLALNAFLWELDEPDSCDMCLQTPREAKR